MKEKKRHTKYYYTKRNELKRNKMNNINVFNMGNNKPKAFKISIQALKRIQQTYVYKYTRSV